MKVSQKTRAVVQYLTPAAILYFISAGLLLSGTLPRSSDLIKYVGGAAGLSLILTLSQDLVPKPFKEFLVFWRINARLPGHRAFSPVFQKPDRYDISKISNVIELQEASPAKQQNIFYGLYKKHSKEMRVEHYSFRYIAWRDTACLVFLLSVLTLPIAAIFGGAAIIPSAAKLAAASFIAYCLIGSAARQSANELVFQVLSAETLGKRHAIK